MVVARLKIIVLLLALGACKNEPKEEAKSEETKNEAPKVKISEIEEGIKAHIEGKTKEDGYFHLKDAAPQVGACTYGVPF